MKYVPGRVGVPVIWALSVALSMALVVGCSKAGPHFDEVYSSGRYFVKLRHDTNKAGLTESQALDHPFQISPEQMALVLSKIEFEEYSFFKWRGKGPLFYQEEIEALAEPLAMAFSKADENQFVVFRSSAKKRDLLWKTVRITDGMMFFRDGKLNLIVGNLNWEVLSEEKQMYEGDPRELALLSPLRLQAADGIEPPEQIRDDRYLKRAHQNWLVVDLDTVLAGAEPVEEEKPPPPTEMTVEERLRVLKQLLDDGIITQEEYEQKKKELLEDL